MGNQESALPATLLRLQILLTIITTSSYNYYVHDVVSLVGPSVRGSQRLDAKTLFSGPKA